MTDETKPDWQEWLGRSAQSDDTLTPGLLARFRATLDTASNCDALPLGLHWCLCLPEAATARLDTDGHPMRGDFLPPLPHPRRMWAGSTVEFLAPMHVGSSIRRSSKIASIRETTGGSGALAFVEVDHATFADEILAVQERQTLVYRGVASGQPPREIASAPRFGDWTLQRSITPGPVLLFRYSALTFNSHRIHYDLPYAQNGEGYRGLVVHGPLIASLLLDLVARECGGETVRSFTFRAIAPAFADDELHLLGAREGNMIRLEAQTAAGSTLVKAEAGFA